jgi:hypothetical protein
MGTENSRAPLRSSAQRRYHYDKWAIWNTGSSWRMRLATTSASVGVAMDAAWHAFLARGGLVDGRLLVYGSGGKLRATYSFTDALPAQVFTAGVGETGGEIAQATVVWACRSVRKAA